MDHISVLSEDWKGCWKYILVQLEALISPSLESCVSWLWPPVTCHNPHILPMSKRWENIETAVHPSILDVLTVQATLILKILLKLGVDVMGNWLPTIETKNKRRKGENASLPSPGSDIDTLEFTIVNLISSFFHISCLPWWKSRLFTPYPRPDKTKICVAVFAPSVQSWVLLENKISSNGCWRNKGCKMMWKYILVKSSHVAGVKFQ